MRHQLKLEILVRAFKKLFFKLINPRECNLVEGIYLFLKLSKIQFKKFTFKLLEINLKAHYFIRKFEGSSHDNFLIASRINLKALCVLTSMNKKRMKRKVIFIEEKTTAKSPMTKTC